MSQATPVIRVRNVSKAYRIYAKPHHRLLQGVMRWRTYYTDFWALQNVDVEVHAGETVGVVGRNGSGKSTLLQIICGTVTPSSGDVTVNGRIAALLELGSGFNPEFTGRENAYLNAAILGLSRSEVAERFPDIEAFAEIGSFMDQPVKTYSSGMFVRLAFSVAIHVSPKVLIVDEALAVGDARFQAKCLNAIKRMKESGTTILFVSHDVGSVRSLCDRSIWLDRGRIRMEGEVFPVTAQYTQFLFEGEASAEALVDHGDDMPIGDDLVDDGEVAISGGAAVEALEHSRPINHWGTHPGCILEAGIYDVHGARKDVFLEFEKMFVRIRFRVPRGVDRKALSMAFSIKNLRGNDLIVSATWDQGKGQFVGAEDEYLVTFEIDTRLNSGKYLLVAALEDRSGPTIQYYEYVEGAQYFSTLFATEYCGVFLPEVRQSILPVVSSHRVPNHQV